MHIFLKAPIRLMFNFNIIYSKYLTKILGTEPQKLFYITFYVNIYRNWYIRGFKLTLLFLISQKDLFLFQTFLLIQKPSRIKLFFGRYPNKFFVLYVY